MTSTGRVRSRLHYYDISRLSEHANSHTLYTNTHRRGQFLRLCREIAGDLVFCPPSLSLARASSAKFRFIASAISPRVRMNVYTLPTIYEALSTCFPFILRAPRGSLSPRALLPAADLFIALRSFFPPATLANACVRIYFSPTECYLSGVVLCSLFSVYL